MNCEVSELLGKTLVSITGANEGSDEIIFGWEQISHVS